MIGSDRRASNRVLGDIRIDELPAGLDDHQREIFQRIAEGPRGIVRGPLALMLHSPGLAEHAQALGEFARFHSVFPPNLSELIILIVARARDCEYEWRVHGPIAIRSGVSAEVVEAIRTHSEPAFSEPAQQAVYDFATALLRNNHVPDEAFERFRALFGERGVVEIAGILGYYTLIAFMVNSVQKTGSVLAPPAVQPSHEDVHA